ncbi:MAG: response regulator transcription factor [Flavobacteriales bacterium]|nr:response regulator transcription factor [Flavobacteriales bacterium]
MMRVLIVDDERLARRELRTLLSEFPNVEIVGECANAEEGIEAIQEHDPDLVFLDIQMPDKNGFDMLADLDDVPHVIFVTAYDEHALRAFQVNALDYLLKPVEENRLAEALERVEKRVKTTPVPVSIDGEKKLGPEDQIFLKDGEKCWFVTLSDVRMFQSEGNYVKVYFNNYKPLILRSLNALEERLDERTFFRANRKYIVNLRWISHIENWFNGGLRLTLKDDTTVEVSRRQASKFKELMSL